MHLKTLLKTLTRPGRVLGRRAEPDRAGPRPAFRLGRYVLVKWQIGVNGTVSEHTTRTASDVTTWAPPSVTVDPSQVTDSRQPVLSFRHRSSHHPRMHSAISFTRITSADETHRQFVL